MRTLLAVLVIAAACGKGKPTSQDKPGSGTAAHGPENTQAPDVVLPAASGTPPKKDKALDEPTLKALSELKFPGWDLRPMEVSDKAVILRQTTQTAPKLSVTMVIRSCEVAKSCPPMELDKWKSDDAFRDRMIGVLKSAKDTVFEVGTLDFNGQPVITSYTLGQSFAPDEHGNTPGTYAHKFSLHFNDGTNTIQVVAGYADAQLKAKEDMVATIPRTDLEKTARAFFDAYTHAW